MRFVVLLFGLLAIPLTALAGAAFLFLDVAFKFLQDSAPDVEKKLPDLTSFSSDPLSHTGLFLVIAAAYGFLGVILSLMRCGWQGALLLIIPVVCAAIMNPLILAVSGLQLFTGLLSFLVFPKPIAAPQAASANDSDDK